MNFTNVFVHLKKLLLPQVFNGFCASASLLTADDNLWECGPTTKLFIKLLSSEVYIENVFSKRPSFCGVYFFNLRAIGATISSVDCSIFRCFSHNFTGSKKGTLSPPRASDSDILYIRKNNALSLHHQGQMIHCQDHTHQQPLSSETDW